MTPTTSYELNQGEISIGLVAKGSHGSWDVDVDETLAGEQRWFLEVDGPPLYLNLQIDHPATIEKLLCFLKSRLDGDGSENSHVPNSLLVDELEISRMGENHVQFIWDTETNDRCAVSIAGNAGLCVRVMIDRRELQDLVGALQQVRDELSEDGLIANLSTGNA